MALEGSHDPLAAHRRASQVQGLLVYHELPQPHWTAIRREGNAILSFDSKRTAPDLLTSAKLFELTDDLRMFQIFSPIS